jgi:hypothetical protein
MRSVTWNSAYGPPLDAGSLIGTNPGTEADTKSDANPSSNPIVSFKLVKKMDRWLWVLAASCLSWQCGLGTDLANTGLCIVCRRLSLKRNSREYGCAAYNYQNVVSTLKQGNRNLVATEVPSSRFAGSLRLKMGEGESKGVSGFETSMEEGRASKPTRAWTSSI